jgi:hypothetical protein
VTALDEHGFDMGAFAKQVVADVKSGKGAEVSARPGYKAEAEQDNHENLGEAINLPDMRADSQLPSENTSSLQKTYHIFRVKNEFYGLDNTANSVEIINETAEAIAHKGDHLLRRIRDHLTFVNSRTIFGRRISAVGKKISTSLISLANATHKKAPLSDYTSLLKNEANIVNIIQDIHGPSVSLILEGYYGYNIIKIVEDVYGIKQGYPLDAEKLRTDSYGPGVLFKARLVKDVEDMIANYILNQFPEDSVSLIRQNFYGYNMVKFGKAVYGLKKGLAFDEKKASHAEYEPGALFKAGQLRDLEAQIVNHAFRDRGSQHQDHLLAQDKELKLYEYRTGYEVVLGDLKK